MASDLLPGANRVGLSRREFIVRLSGVAAGLPLLAACTTPTAPTPPAPAPTAAPPTLAAAATAVKPAATTAPAAPAATSAPPPVPTQAAPAAAQSNVVGGVRLPTYAPIPAARADYPGTDDASVDNGYKAYPTNRFQAVATPPGDGSEVSVMTYTSSTVPVALDQNPWWQAVNKEMNVNLKLNVTPFADYFGSKLQTTIAGGDLPDMFFIIADPGITLVPEFFNAKCADLTPYVSGDAVKEYPNLAAIPTRAWKTTIFDGKIFGVPVPLRPYFWWFWVHQELLDQAGTPQPTNADELKRQLQQMTLPQQGQWGIGVEIGPQYAWGLFMGLWPAIFGAPNNWASDANGKFTATFESPQYKAATAYARDLYAAGVFHPDSTQYNTLSARDAFQARKFAFRYDGLEANGWLKPPLQLTPPNNIRMVRPFGAEGGPGSYWLGRPNFGYTVVPKTLSPERVKMLLRLMNYIAAPFGSEEDLLLRYGVKDVDYQLDPDGNPIVTDKGRADNVPWRNIVAPAPVLYVPGQPNFPPPLQGDEAALAAVAVEDASVGYVSRTYASKGAAANRTIGEGLSDIVTGRRPMNDYDTIVKEWLDAVGTVAKNEYAQAYATAQGQR